MTAPIRLVGRRRSLVARSGGGRGLRRGPFDADDPLVGLIVVCVEGDEFPDAAARVGGGDDEGLVSGVDCVGEVGDLGGGEEPFLGVLDPGQGDVATWGTGDEPGGDRIVTDPCEELVGLADGGRGVAVGVEVGDPLAPLFSDLPKAVLAALIIDAVAFGMMNVAEMKRLFRVARADFWIAVAAILGVLGAGVLAGVIIGVVLSIGWLVYVSAKPTMPVLGHKPGSQVFRSLDEFPDGKTYPGLLVMRFDAGLYFGSSDALEDRLRVLANEADPPLHTAVIDFEGINFIDSQGSSKITEIIELAEVRGVEVRLTRVKPHVLALLRRDGVIAALGENKVYSNVYEAAADRISGDTPP